MINLELHVSLEERGDIPVEARLTNASEVGGDMRRMKTSERNVILDCGTPPCTSRQTSPLRSFRIFSNHNERRENLKRRLYVQCLS